MKFCKKYEEYMQGHGRGQRKLPGVGFKKLKKILKRCRRQIHSHEDTVHALDDHQIGDGIPHDSSTCPQHCPVCDGTFFPSLLEEMSAVVGFFNERAQKLLELHLASGFSKCFIWLKDKMQGNHVTLIQEGRELVTYAIINAIAMRKILKKYDKIHYSKQGQVFKSQAQSMHVEILQSPWLCELMAFHINLRESKVNSKVAPPLFGSCSLVFDDGKPSLSCELMAFHSTLMGSKVNSNAAPPPLLGDCSLVFDDEKPSLSCELFDSVKLEIDLTCCICLETFFEPVSLTCGHIFCYMCACKASSVTIVDGLKAANHDKKCPICRESGVYESAVHLEELHILLSRSCPEYWEDRRKAEKIERVQQTKEHWESQCRLFMGV